MMTSEVVVYVAPCVHTIFADGDEIAIEPRIEMTPYPITVHMMYYGLKCVF